MRHMDEGLLQAWLDGPRAGLDDGERIAVEEHLARCAECAERLAELRATSERASELLVLTEEADHEIPSFDDVVRRARKLEGEADPVGSPRPWWGRRTAWAASIAVALGAGWLANEWNTGPSEVTMPPVRAREAPASLDAVTGAAEPGAAAAPGNDATGQALAPSSEMARRVPPAVEEESRAVESRAALVQGAPVSVDSNAFAAGAGDVGVAAAERAVAEAPAPRAVEPEARLSPPPVEPDPVFLVDDAVAGAAAETAQPGVVVSKGVADARWRAVSLDEARALTSFPIGIVPGLPVRSVHVGSFEGVSVVRVAQELDGGGPLVLIQSVQPLAFAPDEPGSRASRTGLDGVTVTGWAGLPMDSLQSLVDRTGTN